jgi:hypothetical protein
MMDLKPGLRLRSQVGDTEVVVIKGSGAGELTSGGVPLVALDDPVADGTSVAPDHQGNTLLGKRYTDAEDTVELLCTKAGEGALSSNGQFLSLKETKALPASD